MKFLSHYGAKTHTIPSTYNDPFLPFSASKIGAVCCLQRVISPHLNIALHVHIDRDSINGMSDSIWLKYPLTHLSAATDWLLALGGAGNNVHMI